VGHALRTRNRWCPRPRAHGASPFALLLQHLHVEGLGVNFLTNALIHEGLLCKQSGIRYHCDETIPLHAKTEKAPTMRLLSSSLAIAVLATSLAACKKDDVPTPDQSTAETNALAATYGAKKIYLWNRRTKSKEDNIWRSCWYYKEALPKDGLSERQAMYESVRLNRFSLHDDHVQRALRDQFAVNLRQVGIELIPCGLSVAGFGVSIAAAIGSGGLASIGAFLAGAGLINVCIGKTANITLLTTKWTGSADAITSLQNGETGLGKKVSAKKSEVDMFREAIKTAVSLGYESNPECPEPKDFKDEIMSKGMGE
jgi:hypothetical protein